MWLPLHRQKPDMRLLLATTAAMQTAVANVRIAEERSYGTGLADLKGLTPEALVEIIRKPHISRTWHYRPK